jgi:hypothetical protein
MTSTDGITMLFPFTLLMSVNMLANFLRYLMYRLTPEKQKSKPAIGVDEQPVLILEYNNTLQPVIVWIATIVCIAVSLYIFFFADHVVRQEIERHRTFFSLNSEQSYILYYLAWKFQGLFVAFIMCVQFIRSFTRKVIFYKNAVVVDNSIMGKRELSLDENVRRYEYWGIYKYIYDERKGINLQVYNKKFMEMTHKQEKLLTEIMSRIPKKTKRFMLI